MKKLILCVATAALLATPTFAVAEEDGNGRKSIPNIDVELKNSQLGVIVFGNNNNQNGDIRSKVYIANTKLPGMIEEYRIPSLPDYVFVSNSVNVGHSSAQQSFINGVKFPDLDENGLPVATLDENGDAVTPKFEPTNVNQSSYNGISESTVGNNIRINPVLDTKGLLASFEDFFINGLKIKGFWTHDHHFSGDVYIDNMNE